jgi:hypothetical protein
MSDEADQPPPIDPVLGPFFRMKGLELQKFLRIFYSVPDSPEGIYISNNQKELTSQLQARSWLKKLTPNLEYDIEPERVLGFDRSDVVDPGYVHFDSCLVPHNRDNWVDNKLYASSLLDISERWRAPVGKSVYDDPDQSFHSVVLYHMSLQSAVGNWDYEAGGVQCAVMPEGTTVDKLEEEKMNTLYFGDPEKLVAFVQSVVSRVELDQNGKGFFSPQELYGLEGDGLERIGAVALIESKDHQKTIDDNAY